MLGKIKSRRKIGHQSINDTMNMNLGKLLAMMRDKEAWHAAVHGVTKSQT